jgi:transketolase
MPNLTIIDPCDALEISQVVPAIAEHQGPVYLRLLRGKVPLVLDKYDYRYQHGKAQRLRGGKHAMIISSGLMTMRALEAAEALEKQGIEVGVVHSPVIKPLDEATILREAGEAVDMNRLVITAENHSVVGGLGEAIAGVLMRNNVTPRFKQIALPDAFLAAGALPTLHDRYGISTEAMVKQITAWLAG